jgi:hypothetical protein
MWFYLMLSLSISYSSQLAIILFLFHLTLLFRLCLLFRGQNTKSLILAWLTMFSFVGLTRLTKSPGVVMHPWEFSSI